MADVDPIIGGKLFMRLTDFGDMRLEAMDHAGVHRAVLSISGPGVQAEPDTAVAIARAQEAERFSAREIQKRPNHYLGFGHLPMQDPGAAAHELTRCTADGCGAMINGHTNGVSDEASLDPFWERAAALDAPIYLHPTGSVGCR